MEQRGTEMGQAPYPPPYGQQQPQPSYPPQQYPTQPPSQPYPAKPNPTQPYPAQPYPAYQQQSVSTTNVVVATTPQAPQTIVIERQSNDLTGLDQAGMAMAVCNTFCCFIPLGIAAIIVSAIAFRKRGDGNHDEANSLSKISIGLSVAGFILGIILIIIIVVLSAASTNYDY